MSRWIATAALAAALVLSPAGCGPSAPPTSGKGGAATGPAGPATSGSPAPTGKDTAKPSSGHHDPG
jgi:hypothetical protein